MWNRFLWSLIFPVTSDSAQMIWVSWCSCWRVHLQTHLRSDFWPHLCDVKTAAVPPAAHVSYLGVWSVFSHRLWGHTWSYILTSSTAWPRFPRPPPLTRFLSQQALRQKPQPPSSVTQPSRCSSITSGDHILWKQWGRRFSSSSSSSQSDRRYKHLRRMTANLSHYRKMCQLSHWDKAGRLEYGAFDNHIHSVVGCKCACKCKTSVTTFLKKKNCSFLQKTVQNSKTVLYYSSFKWASNCFVLTH